MRGLPAPAILPADRCPVTKQEYPFWFFVLMLLVMLYFFLHMFAPFLMVFVWALILTTTFYPVYEWILRRTGGREGLAASLMVLSLTVVLILPVLFVMLIIARESMETFNQVSTRLNSPDLWSVQRILQHPAAQKVKLLFSNYADLEKISLKNTIQQFLNYLTSFLVDQSTNLFSSIAHLLLQFFLLLIATFTMFKDGQQILREIRKLSPMDAEREKKIMDRFSDVTRATMLGNFTTALIQGVFGGFGFLIIGLPSPLLWGTVMAFCSLVPMVGTLLIWGPAAIYLAMTGHLLRGVILILWCGLMSLFTDNILKPLIIRGKAKLHPVLIFFSIIGGLSFFGFSGLILGPLVTALTFVFLEIYREEFREQLPGTVKLTREQVEAALRGQDQV